MPAKEGVMCAGLEKPGTEERAAVPAAKLAAKLIDAVWWRSGEIAFAAKLVERTLFAKEAITAICPRAISTAAGTTTAHNKATKRWAR